MTAGPARPKRYHSPDLIRAAYFAGAGRPAKEIAEIIGGTTADRIAAVLRRAGLKPHYPRSGRTSIVIHVDAETMRLLRAIAAPEGEDPEAVAADLIEQAAIRRHNTMKSRKA